MKNVECKLLTYHLFELLFPAWNFNTGNPKAFIDFFHFVRNLRNLKKSTWLGRVKQTSGTIVMAGQNQTILRLVVFLNMD